MKKILLAGALMLGLFTGATAQNKIGYIDTDELMAAMPEAAKAQDELNEYQQNLGVQYQDLMRELQTKDSLFVKDSLKMSASLKQIKRDELVKLYQRVQSWQQEGQEMYQAEAQKKILPIRNKALDAIKAVAKDNGYGYVVEKSTLIVFPPGDDLLPLVRRKLGITAPVAPAAAPARK